MMLLEGRGVVMSEEPLSGHLRMHGHEAATEDSLKPLMYIQPGRTGLMEGYLAHKKQRAPRTLE